MIYDLQKAGIWKRISALIFDVILVAMLSVGFMYLISAVTGYDGYNNKLGECYSKYEKQYGVKFNVTLSEYEKLSEEELGKYNDAYNALISDNEAMKTYGMVINLTLLITSLGIFCAMAVLDVGVPLFLKNGQTLGKKIFGICVMRTDGVKLGTVSLLIRSLLGKYTVETMVPVLIGLMIYFNTVGLTGTVILALLLILQLVLMEVTKTNSVIHDILAGTVVVDMSSQMIFNSQTEMIEYKKKLAAEEAAKPGD